jgi:hypothetical protein
VTLPVARSADELAAEGWTITWAGTRSAHAGDGGGAWHTDTEGSSWATVDTSSLGFRVTRNVNYVSGVVVGISAGVDSDTATMLRAPDEGTRAALAAAAAVVGASAVYRPSALGFQARINDFVGNRYLPPAAAVRPGGGHSALVRRFVASGAWRVAHVGFERATCSHSSWSSWSRCVCGALGAGGGGGSSGGSGLRTRYRHQLDTDLACTPSSSDGGRTQAHDECRCTAAESREEMAGASPLLPPGAGNSTAPGGAAAAARAAAGATSGALPPTRNAVAVASATAVHGASNSNSNSNSNAVRAAASAPAASTTSTAPLASPQQQQQQQRRRRRQTSHRAAQLLFAGAWLLVALAAVRIGSAGSRSRAPGPSAGIGSSGEEATELVVAEQAAAGRPSDFGSGASHGGGGAAAEAGGGATSPGKAAAADSSSQHQRNWHQHQHQAATEPDLEVVLTSGQATNVRAASKGLADAGRMVLFS